MNRKQYARTFFCFSPGVMLGTFVLETALFLYVFFVKKMSRTTLLGLLLLAGLALFQLAEYGICEAWGWQDRTWATLGFMMITFLPPLGLHLVYHIAGRTHSRLVAAGYVVAGVWSLALASGQLMDGAFCGGNYIIFHIKNPFEQWYYITYDLTMLAAITQAWRFSLATTRQRQRALRSLTVGYLCFIVPTVLFSIINTQRHTDSPLPSVMCGFAVIFAIILTFKVLPDKGTFSQRKRRV